MPLLLYQSQLNIGHRHGEIQQRNLGTSSDRKSQPSFRLNQSLQQLWMETIVTQINQRLLQTIDHVSR